MLVVFRIVKGQDPNGPRLSGATLDAQSQFGEWKGVTDCNGQFVTEGLGLAPGHYDVTISAPGYKSRLVPMDLFSSGIVTEGLDLGLPPVPDPRLLQTGQLTGQGFTIQTTKYGAMPWWPGCWAWLDAQTRAECAAALIAHGDDICLIYLPYGPPLYDEPDQFYSADKFPALDMTNGGTAIDPAFPQLVAEALTLGFKGVWVGIDAEDNNITDPNGHHRGFNRGMALTDLVRQSLGPLNPYTAKLLLWDSVFYGLSPDELRAYFEAQHAEDPGGVYGLEHNTGHLPAGNGASDWQPGGAMQYCSLLLGEFGFQQHDDTIWQILARALGPTYRRPSDQPAGDDLRPPFYLVNGCVYRVFEFSMFNAVRANPIGSLDLAIDADRTYFRACGAPYVS